MTDQHGIPPKDIRVAMSFKNNLILIRMEKAGFKTVSELGRAAGIADSELGHLINMKELPTTKSGKWRTTVVKLADFFGCLPDDLFSEFQQGTVLEKNRANAEVHFGEIQAMLAVQNAQLLDPVRAVEQAEMRAAVIQALDTLSPQYRDVLMARFGIDQPEMTLEEIAGETGLTPEAIRQREAAALRLLRHPRQSRHLREVCGLGEGDEF